MSSFKDSSRKQDPTLPVPPPDVYSIPSHLTAKELGKVNVHKTPEGLVVDFTILMPPQGKEAEGFQTGVALDCSDSMKSAYGKGLTGQIPPDAAKAYKRQGWVESKSTDGKKRKSFTKDAVDDAIRNGYVKKTPNTVEPSVRKFVGFLAGEWDADGSTTVIYWACDDGRAYEVLGDFTEQQCKVLKVEGPKDKDFGAGTFLAPALQYFLDRFRDAKRGMYVFITDGKLDDLEDVKALTTKLAKEIEGEKRNPVKCVLVGVGDEIDEAQMIELDNLETGTDVDVWDHKIAEDLRTVMEIFAEMVDETMIIAPTGSVCDSSGKVVKNYTDGLPAKVVFTLPPEAQFFELVVGKQKIHQTVIVS